MAARQRRNRNNIDVIFNGLFKHFFGRGKKRSHIHVETDIGISRSNDFRPAIVSVLPHFGN